MKAVVCNKYGPPEVMQLKQCNKPHIKNDEVLIKIFAASVTNSDIFIRSSKVSLPLLLPFRLMIGITKPRNPIIGQVFSGIIEQIGPRITRFKPGDRVYGLTGLSLGAYAEYKSMKEINSKQGCIALMPENVSFEEATAVAYGGLLALQFLDKKELNKYSKILIYGAASTSGIIALQYLKYLGINITAVCRENKFQFVKSLGADKTLDYTRTESISDLEIL